jgi:hypothetical protein
VRNPRLKKCSMPDRLMGLIPKAFAVLTNRMLYVASIIIAGWATRDRSW